jgi:hypothetical protein
MMDIRMEAIRSILDLHLLKGQIPRQDLEHSLQRLMASGKMRSILKNFQSNRVLGIDDFDTLLCLRFAMSCPDEPSHSLLRKMRFIATLSTLLHSYITGDLDTEDFHSQYQSVVQEHWSEKLDKEFVSVLFELSYVFSLADADIDSIDRMDRIDIVYVCIKTINRLEGYWKLIVG